MPRIFGLRVVRVRWERILCLIAWCACAGALVHASLQRKELERQRKELDASARHAARQAERIRATAAEAEGLKQELTRARTDLGILEQHYDWVCGVLRSVPNSDRFQWQPIGMRLPIPVPRVEGQILAVQGQSVLLSVGREADVEPGFRFSIYSGSLFLGKVVIERVGPSSCTGKVLFTVEGRHFAKGDSAATRLD